MILQNVEKIKESAEARKIGKAFIPVIKLA